MIAAKESGVTDLDLETDGEAWGYVGLDDRLDRDIEWGDAGGRGGGCCPVLHGDPCSEEE